MRFRTKMFAVSGGQQTPFYGELRPVTGMEVTEAAAQVITRFKVFCPPTLDLTAYDKVRLLGADYDVTGPPEPHMIGGRVDHIEAYVERVTG